jgi:hypothetical protein
MLNDKRPHEIIKKETSEIIGTYPNFAEAYKAYEKLGWEMTDHAIGLVEQRELNHD